MTRISLFSSVGSTTFSIFNPAALATSSREMSGSNWGAPRVPTSMTVTSKPPRRIKSLMYAYSFPLLSKRPSNTIVFFTLSSGHFHSIRSLRFFGRSLPSPYNNATLYLIALNILYHWQHNDNKAHPSLSHPEQSRETDRGVEGLTFLREWPTFSSTLLGGMIYR